MNKRYSVVVVVRGEICDKNFLGLSETLKDFERVFANYCLKYYMLLIA